ncbi:MAG: thioredoxin family protein [Planctomycetota bacterium]|nr:thioredoxin family protein [Planctomycetota bacterium]
MTSIRTRKPLGLLLVAALVLPLAGLLAVPVSAEDAPGSDAPALEEVHIPWVLDFNAAKAKAKAENKHLLINFTGSDWCGWCKKLEGEVFGKKAFLDTATKNYVMVFLDFPNAQELKDKVVDAALNQRLSQEFGVAGFPTIMLTNADGHPYARTGYKAGGPAPYLEHLTELRGKNTPVEALAGAGAEKASVEQLQAGFAVMAEQNLLAYPAYSWVLAKAKTVDADGSLGMKTAVEKIEEEVALKAVMPKRRGEQPDFAKIHEILKDSKHLSGMSFVNAGFGTANWLLESGKAAEAKALAEKVAKDPIFANEPRAKTAIDGFIAKCVAAIEAAKTDEAK